MGSSGAGSFPGKPLKCRSDQQQGLVEQHRNLTRRSWAPGLQQEPGERSLGEQLLKNTQKLTENWGEMLELHLILRDCERKQQPHKGGAFRSGVWREQVQPTVTLLIKFGMLGSPTSPFPMPGCGFCHDVEFSEPALSSASRVWYSVVKKRDCFYITFYLVFFQIKPCVEVMTFIVGNTEKIPFPAHEL